MEYQTYLKDCNCKHDGIIIKDGISVCRWCRTPYGKGGCMYYEEEHFKVKKEPLFITEDNVPIYVDDSFYYIGDAMNICRTKCFWYNDGDFTKFKTFHSLEAAKEYILMNKPLLSLNDLLDNWDDNPIGNRGLYKNAPLFLNFKEAAKIKLKQ